MAQFEPDLVQLNNLPDKEEVPAIDPEGNSMGDQRRDRLNVEFGVFGDGPWVYDKGKAEILFDRFVKWVAGSVYWQVILN